MYQKDIAKLPPRPITASTANSRNREAIRQYGSVLKDVPPFLAYANGKLLEIPSRPQTHHSSASKLFDLTHEHYTKLTNERYAIEQ